MAQPGLKELLLGFVEVDVVVHMDRIVFSDPTRRTLNTKPDGGQPGSTDPLWGLYHFGLNQYAHDKITALMLALARATA